jgi:hypothetical protein
MVPRSGSRDPSLWGGRFRHRAVRQLASGARRKQARQRDGKAELGSNTFILAVTRRNHIPGMKTSKRGVSVLSPSVLPLRYTPGSWRGRYQTDRHPGAALQKTAVCPAGSCQDDAP